ncbi:MAG: hypothetical protein M1820_004963 [Bogoriella megaspora]|nr:MAG: hypothetical protein M1820_004963 [Bogoriella megaspora]
MSRYAAVHEVSRLAGPGDARPTALQVVEDEGLVGKLKDKVVLITGASSGIGVETARAFHTTGATVYITARDVAKGEETIKYILDKDEDKVNAAEIHLIKMDLDSTASVRLAAEEFLKQSKSLHILINNAGVMACPESKTGDGFETQFGTNHLGEYLHDFKHLRAYGPVLRKTGHFLLTYLLLPTMLSSASKEFPARVVNVSSVGHFWGQVRFEDPNFSESGSYNPQAAYGQSKTANIYHANELTNRYADRNLYAVSLMPGGVMTGLQKYVPPEHFKLLQDPKVQRFIMDAEQGAATTMVAAIGKDFKYKGRIYMEMCDEAGPSKGNGGHMDPGHSPWAFDKEKEAKLWNLSCELLGLNNEL